MAAEGYSEMYKVTKGSEVVTLFSMNSSLNLQLLCFVAAADLILTAQPWPPIYVNVQV